jgi:hypothetical protein
MRAIAIIVIILGVASLGIGVLFYINSVSAEDEVAESIAPLPLDQLDAQYDQVTAQYNQMKEAGAPPSAEFNYLYGNKVGLGLARANAGTANFVMMSGIVQAIVGIGLILAGVALLKKE